MSEEESQGLADDQIHIMRRIKDTKLTVDVVLVEKSFTIGELSELNPGSVLSFDVEGDCPASLTVNDKSLAIGTVVQIQSNYGLQVKELVE